jgi:phosphate/sulfate permease
MFIELFIFAAGLLILFAIFDLMVGVSNDAANFLNSSLGSKVAPRHIILIIASLGILAGVTFSSGMMEVARKGIFNPSFFTMPDLIILFLAVMITDVILLDIFNSFGLPTSTTVSIVFELLGAAVALSVIKIISSGGTAISIFQYINTHKAIIIIVGILLSVIVSFIFGAIVQFFTRLFFTFNYTKKLKRYGAIWGGIALSSITYFILIKGAKSATFMTPQAIAWIYAHTSLILLSIFLVSSVFLYILTLLKVNILKPIILIGTFALAMAFAANDLVNFIGVPLAGFQSLKIAMATSDPFLTPMVALSKKVQPEPYFLLIAGLIMVLTLWFSKKARSVSSTELSLGNQDETDEKYESTYLSRNIVKMFLSFFEGINSLAHKSVRLWFMRRFSRKNITEPKQGKSSFDLLRASVNLMVASAVISYATSHKLPLSTTYVTFMVSMGTSFADQAWGRDSAVYRITGVLAVIGGWFMTAISAFFTAFVFAFFIFHTKAYGVIALLLLVIYVLWTNHTKHKNKINTAQEESVFNLKKVNDIPSTISTTFQHMSILIKEIRSSTNNTLNGLFRQDSVILKKEKAKLNKFNRWSNIIIANVFKAMRLIQKENSAEYFKYAQTSRRLQKLINGHREIVFRSHQHVTNHHKGLLATQVVELKGMQIILDKTFEEIQKILTGNEIDNSKNAEKYHNDLISLADKLNTNQMKRISNNTSKTRLSILFYSIIGASITMSKQNIKLIEIFNDSFGDIN